MKSPTIWSPGNTLGHLAGSALPVIACALLLTGCPTGETPSNSPENGNGHSRPVRLLVVGDPHLADAMEREWTASGQGELTIRQLSIDELAAADRLAADCVVYPSDQLGLLVERGLIVPLPASVLASGQHGRTDIFRLLRLHESGWGGTPYAVPFGSPQFVLLYRKDILAKIDRRPPETWQEYQEIAQSAEQYLAAADESKTGTPHAAAEPLANGWAGKLFLARAAAYVRHADYYSAAFDFETMQPMIAAPPFVKALQDTVAAAKLSGPERMEMTPQLARDIFFAGHAALAITWPTAADARQPAKSQERLDIGVAELPGSDQVYDFRTKKWESRDEVAHVPLLSISGRLGSITSSARRTRDAADALVWLTSPQMSALISPHSPETTLFRSSHLAGPRRWVGPRLGEKAAHQYAGAVQTALGRPQWMFAPRLPGNQRYMKSLDEAVRKAVRGEATPQQALEEAADRWQQITEELGRENQRDAYQQSLGLKT